VSPHFLIGNLFRNPIFCDTGIVDKHIHVTILLLDLSSHTGNIFLRGDITSNSKRRFSCDFLNFSLYFFQSLLRSGNQNYVSSESAQVKGCLSSQPTGCSSDDDDFILNFHVYPSNGFNFIVVSPAHLL